MTHGIGKVVVAVVVLASGLAFVRLNAGADAEREGPKGTSTKKPTDEDKPGLQTPALRMFMRAKLKASERILEGLVTEDYEKITDGATKLREMGAAEKWRVSNDVMYRQRSDQFRRVAGDLLKAAKDRNLEQASLHWVEATMSCIDCHRWVRATLIADGEEGAGR